MEGAAGRRDLRARRVAREDDALAAGARDRAPAPPRAAPGYRDGPDRRRARRVAAELDDAAEIHDGDAVADVLDHGEIVRDEEVGEAEPRLEVDQQVEDLRLDRDVERRDRLVGDDQLRLERERARDADALALAAGELVRIAARPRPASSPTRRAARPPAPARSARRRCRGSTSGSAMMRADVSADRARHRGPGRRSACRAGAARSAAAPSAAQVLAVEADASARRARSAAAAAAPRVDLPQPDSPTMPSVSPRAERRAIDAVHGAHDAVPSVTRKCLATPVEPRAARARPSLTAPDSSRPPMRRRRPRTAAAARSGSASIARGQRSAKLQPVPRRPGGGTVPGMVGSLPRAAPSRGTAASRPAYRDGAAGGTGPRPAPPRRCGRHTSRRPGRPSRRRRPCRG